MITYLRPRGGVETGAIRTTLPVKATRERLVDWKIEVMGVQIVVGDVDAARELLQEGA